MGELWSHEHELVPLSAAASLAYFELTEVRGELGSEENLGDVIELVAIALSQLAPIRAQSPRGGGETSVLSPAQVKELLFSPIREGRPVPNLENFYIRRADLHAAISSLR